MAWGPEDVELVEATRVIAEVPGGREALRVLSIVAREQPAAMRHLIQACGDLIRECVRRGWMHPRTLEELEAPDRPN